MTQTPLHRCAAASKLLDLMVEDKDHKKLTRKFGRLFELTNRTLGHVKHIEDKQVRNWLCDMVIDEGRRKIGDIVCAPIIATYALNVLNAVKRRFKKENYK